MTHKLSNPGSPIRALIVVAVLLTVVACAGYGRAPEPEVQRIADLLEIGSGTILADVGAGDGRWSEALAERVGSEGHVFATEIDESVLDDIRRRIRKAGLDNITAVLGDHEDTGLPDRCCDVLLLRLVYHHFTDPPSMRESMQAALRPGGLVAVIEFEPRESLPDVDGVPERGGHGISADDVVEEMTSAGFEIVSRHDDWEEEDSRYCVVFRR